MIMQMLFVLSVGTSVVKQTATRFGHFLFFFASVNLLIVARRADAGRAGFPPISFTGSEGADVGHARFVA